MIDIAAREVGIDPARAAAAQRGRSRATCRTRRRPAAYDAVSPAETLEQAAELIGYDAFRAEQAPARERRPPRRHRHRPVRRADRRSRSVSMTQRGRHASRRADGR